MRKPLLIALLFVVTMIGFAQNQQRNCGTMEHLQHTLSEDPSLQLRMDQIEMQTSEFVRNYRAQNGQALASISIPVVVHVLYNTSAQNISDALINEQIAQLNRDFSATNSDITKVPSAFQSLISNTGIQFCLAQRDPNGNATNGIVRKQTTVTTFSSNNAMKYTAQGGSDAWPAGQYLNLWVCNLGSGLLGYAQFPGGTAATDGVVVLYSTVGGQNLPGTAAPYNLGRTATHEVGHWLNLRHIWGDANCGSDLVGDTPTQQTSNYGCPSFPKVTCSNGPNGDMFMNYMDYTDDACMYMLTAGQNTRMQALFGTGGARASLLTSQGCVPPSVTCGTPSGVSANNITTTGASISWATVSGATSYNVQYKLSSASTWTTVSSATASISLAGLISASTYNVQVQAVCSIGNSNYSTPVSFSTTSAQTCGTTTSVSAGSVTASGATISWAAVSGAASYNIQYKLGTASTWTTVTSTTTSKAITGLAAASTYNVQVQTVCSFGSSSYSSAISFTTLSAPCTDSYESNNSISAAKTIPYNTTIKAKIATATDTDHFKFKVTSTSKNFLVVADNLPQDYDVKLFKGTTLLYTSQNTGTTPEAFYLNNAATTTYTVRVYGYNGVFDNNNCYNLRVSTSSTPYARTDAGFAVIDDNKEEEDILIYPNPARNSITIEAPFETSGNASFEIYDVTGRQVLVNNLQVEKFVPVTLDVSSLQTGLYVLRVEENGQLYTKKVLINK